MRCVESWLTEPPRRALDDAEAQARPALAGAVELDRELQADLLHLEPPVALRALGLGPRQFRAHRADGLRQTDRFRIRHINTPPLSAD